MGYGRFDPQDWTAYQGTIQGKTTQQVFRNTSGIADDLDPRNIRFRESRDSDQNPASTPILVVGDGTGSMGHLAEQMLRGGCSKLTDAIYDRKPVTDPHLAFGYLGDVHAWDPAPLQVTQFEADTGVAKQLERIWLRGASGGGNASESYHLAWYFAARKVEADAFAKGRKGFLFTWGDEGVPPELTQEHVRRVFGPDESFSEPLSARALLAEARRNWEVFHLIVEEGDGIRSYGRDHVVGGWKDLLGERAILLSDSEKMPEVIVSLMQVTAGVDRDSVARSWSGDTSLVVARAVGNLPSAAGRAGKGGIVRL